MLRDNQSVLAPGGSVCVCMCVSEVCADMTEWIFTLSKCDQTRFQRHRSGDSVLHLSC